MKIHSVETNPATCRVCALWRGERKGAAARRSPRYFAAHVLVEVHLPNSVDRTPESRIGNDAMLVVLPVGWRGCGIAQLVNCSLWIVIEISP
ncbi:hypothetical protein OWS73_08635 [Burkholderia sp. 1B3(2022)]|uniref:hypothetical protein n=1 Tax=Burkholderia sp. 1B3(2022) TaxID=2997425 RepID=UPI002FC6D366